jgi:hypothetical protein
MVPNVWKPNHGGHALSRVTHALNSLLRTVKMNVQESDPIGTSRQIHIRLLLARPTDWVFKIDQKQVKKIVLARKHNTRIKLLQLDSHCGVNEGAWIMRGIGSVKFSIIRAANCKQSMFALRQATNKKLEVLEQTLLASKHRINLCAQFSISCTFNYYYYYYCYFLFKKRGIEGKKKQYQVDELTSLRLKPDMSITLDCHLCSPDDEVATIGCDCSDVTRWNGTTLCNGNEFTSSVCSRNHVAHTLVKS